MRRSANLRGGPLSRAARRLADPDEPEVASSEADPAWTLSRLLDLKGSVDVARALAAKATPSYVTDDPTMALRISRSVASEIGAIRSHARRSFARFATVRGPFATAERVLELVTPRLSSGRSPRAVASVALALWEPAAEEAAMELSSVVRQARSLRKEIGPDVAALGPEAARLERLDALLAIATEEGIDVRVARLIPAAKAPFSKRVAAALEELATPPTSTDLAPWLAPGGPIAEVLISLEAIVLDALDAEATRIEALVSAAARLADVVVPSRSPRRAIDIESEVSP